jgi:hypothetical protein
VLQSDKDFVEIALTGLSAEKCTINLSYIHVVVILTMYSRRKNLKEMKIRLNEDYYFWYCDWCDSENLVLRMKLRDGTYCGACHKPMKLTDMNGVV